MKQIPDLSGIFRVIFVAVDCFNPFGVGNGDVDIVLQKVEYWRPVFTRGFHTGIATLVFNKLVFELRDRMVGGGEAFMW